MTTEKVLKRAPNYKIPKEKLEQASKMWINGDTVTTISDKLDIPVRVLGRQMQYRRKLFPMRRIMKVKRTPQVKVGVDICEKEHEFLYNVAREKRVSVATLIRNAMAIAKEQGYPIVKHDILRGDPLDKEQAERVQRGRPKKKLISYAGAPRRGE